MLRPGSSLKGYAITASDGAIGTVGDLLFEDTTWEVRWIVADTGWWLTGRKILLHPSAIAKADHPLHVLTMALTKGQVSDSPGILADQPVSRQMQDSLFEHYGWNSQWGGGRSAQGTGAPGMALREATNFQARLEHEDRDLRSMAAVTGYECHATDGMVGHLRDVLLDNGAWVIAYIVIDAGTWWSGRRVLLSPQSVKGFDWSNARVDLSLSRDQVKAGPPWEPA
jgi:hypothetical protein